MPEKVSLKKQEDSIFFFFFFFFEVLFFSVEGSLFGRWICSSFSVRAESESFGRTCVEVANIASLSFFLSFFVFFFF